MTPYKAKHACEHTPKCENYFVVHNRLNDCFNLCQREALETFQTIMDELHALPEIKITPRGWTPNQLKTLVRFLSTYECGKHGRLKRGTVPELAEALGKTPKQIYNKISWLRKNGAFQ
jgi:hypothetical protein